MSKPPATPPNSDLDGVHQDEVGNVAAAHAKGQSAADLDRAKKESAGRPDSDRAGESRDDRSC